MTNPTRLLSSFLAALESVALRDPYGICEAARIYPTIHARTVDVVLRGFGTTYTAPHELERIADLETWFRVLE